MFTLGQVIECRPEPNQKLVETKMGLWLCFFFSCTGGSGSGGSGGGGGGSASSVPEIDASSGLLAIAAICAGLALAFELKRRRSALK